MAQKAQAGFITPLLACWGRSFKPLRGCGNGLGGGPAPVIGSFPSRYATFSIRQGRQSKIECEPGFPATRAVAVPKSFEEHPHRGSLNEQDWDVLHEPPSRTPRSIASQYPRLITLPEVNKSSILCRPHLPKSTTQIPSIFPEMNFGFAAIYR